MESSGRKQHPKAHASALPFILVLVLVSAVVAVSGRIYYRDLRERFLAQATDQLAAIADLKVNQIAAWRHERLWDAQLMVANPDFVRAMRRWLDFGPPAGMDSETARWLSIINSERDYDSIILLDRQGIPRAHLLGTATLRQAGRDLALEVMRTGKPQLSDLHRGSDEVIHLDVVAPLVPSGSPTPIGAILLRIDPQHFLFPYLQTWPLPSATGESLLVRRDGDYVLFLHELRHRKNTALSLRLPMTQPGLLSAAALRLGRGTLEGTDYRQLPAVGAFRQVPSSHWHLIAKFDASEVYAPLRQRALLIGTIAVLIIAVTGIGLTLLWRNQRLRFYRQQLEAERERRVLVKHFDHITRHANDIVLLMDQHGRIVEANDRAVESYGYSREELLGLHILDLRDPSGRSLFEEQWEQAGTPGGIIFETLHRRKDSSTFPVEVSSRAIEMDGTSFRQSIIRDISERKRAERQIRESRHFIERILDTTPNLLYIFDLVERKLLYTNRDITGILGYPRGNAELLGTNIMEYLIHPEDLPRVEEHQSLLAASPEGSVHEVEFRARHASGEWRWLRSRVVVFQRNAEGKAVQILGTAQDITEYRALEEQLRHAQKMEAVGRLAGGIAHDFNNLLTAILGFNSLLLEGTTTLDPRREPLLEVQAAAERAASLTRQLLAFSRKQFLQPQTVGLNTLVGGVETMLRRLIGEDIDLLTVLDPHLGQVRVDPGQYEQVIVNLAINARDAMPHGGRLTIETANVTLDAAAARQGIELEPGPYVVTTVRDTGVGMDQATLSRIFEPFYTSKPVGVGTGLGLSTVYGIVKQSGGDISVHSEPGHGATFKIYLPRVDAAPPGTSPPVTGTIAVVESEESVRTLIRRALETAGYTVLDASPEHAFNILAEYASRIDLLVTDTLPPLASSAGIAGRLASLRPGLPILYLSGCGGDIHSSNPPGENLGHLRKPFTPGVLVEQVRTLISQASPRPVQ